MHEICQEIELPFWQNPQCHIFTEYHRDELWLYFDIWEKAGERIEDKLGVLIFKNCYSLSFEKNIKCYFSDELAFHSFILEIKNSIPLSNYLQKIKRNGYGYELPKDDLKHFVVNSHNFQLSILATHYECMVQEKTNANLHIFKKLC